MIAASQIAQYYFDVSLSLVNMEAFLNYVCVLSLRQKLGVDELWDYLEYLSAVNCSLLTAFSGFGRD